MPVVLSSHQPEQSSRRLVVCERFAMTGATAAIANVIRTIPRASELQSLTMALDNLVESSQSFNRRAMRSDPIPMQGRGRRLGSLQHGRIRRKTMHPRSR